MAISKVGLGWPVGERQYTTLAAWVTALKASGSYEEAWCSGNLGTSYVTITSSDFLQGARIWGDVQYTGANHAAIAALPRSITVNSTANILIQDISCTNSNSTQSAMSLSGAKVVAERCYAWQAVDPGSNAATLMVTNYATASNCVAVNTLSTASKVIRPSANGIVKNCIGVGGKYALFSEWTSSKTEKSYGVGASISSCLWSNGRPPGNVTNASEDATGDVGYQNLDPVANFIDYANGDYRIRTTSPLYSAGIGAFFEPSIGELNVNLNHISSTVVTNEPIVTKDKLVILDDIPSGSSVNTLGVAKELRVSLPRVESTATVYVPAVVKGTALTLGLGTIESTNVVHGPLVKPDKLLTLYGIDSTSVMYALTLLKDKWVTLGLLENTTEVYVPEVIGGAIPLPSIAMFQDEGYGLHIRTAREMNDMILALAKRVQLLEQQSRE